MLGLIGSVCYFRADSDDDSDDDTSDGSDYAANASGDEDDGTV